MSASDVPDDLPVLAFADQTAWRAWLGANHEDAPGVWIKMAKKASGIASVDWQQAVDEALCAGWIDGQRRSLDETHFLQRFTPRRPRSVWSSTNVKNVERLTAAGLMLPAGLAQVEAAKTDGRWDAAYAAASSGEIPAELEAALAASPTARAAFDELKSAQRYSICWRVQTPKRADTRERKAAEFVAKLERGEPVP
jgi:uncharacterized protein YdeI (YjbR/CyaY-like superfamily)